jgi:AmmeMemoRadiSam system protein A
MDGAEADRGRVLLAIARHSLAEAFRLGPARRFDEPWLREPGATFVTLRLRGDLRGCVGSIRAYRPLGEDVHANARAAAFGDSRFLPLPAAELSVVTLEVSLLSAPEPLPARREEEALAVLRPGVDGLILELDEHRATFLPQVWEQLPDRREFLAHLKRKAGLAPAFWSVDVRLWRYTVAKWEEPEEMRRWESTSS